MICLYFALIIYLPLMTSGTTPTCWQTIPNASLILAPSFGSLTPRISFFFSFGFGKCVSKNSCRSPGKTPKKSNAHSYLYCQIKSAVIYIYITSNVSNSNRFWNQTALKANTEIQKTIKDKVKKVGPKTVMYFVLIMSNLWLLQRWLWSIFSYFCLILMFCQIIKRGQLFGENYKYFETFATFNTMLVCKHTCYSGRFSYEWNW